MPREIPFARDCQFISDNLFEVSAGALGRPRLVEGLTRQRITLFIAGGQGIFKIIYK
jgi:hypothetical protein